MNTRTFQHEFMRMILKSSNLEWDDAYSLTRQLSSSVLIAIQRKEQEKLIDKEAQEKLKKEQYEKQSKKL